jgi:LPXTG-motif cell wall-anchored protein
MKRMAVTLMVAAVATVAGGSVASAGATYPPTTDPATIDVAAFSPVCQGDIPYIRYNIEVSGTNANTATLTFIDNTGAEIQTYSGMPLSGSVIYPGASSNPQDWPGWKLAANGNWETDPSDANWREGLTVRVQVNPTATGSVSYPPATEACNGPEGADPPVPGTPGELPPTGTNGTMPMILIAGGLVAGGAVLFGSVRRRKTTTA